MLRSCVLILLLAAPALGQRPPEDDMIEPLIHAGRYLEALALCGDLVEEVRQPELQAEYWKWIADIHLAFLDAPEPARRAYERILRDYPGSVYADDALYSLGLLAYEADDLPAARRHLERLGRDYPDSPRRHNADFVLERIARGQAAEKLPPPSWSGQPVRVLLAARATGLRVGATGPMRLVEDSGQSWTRHDRDLRVEVAGGRFSIAGRTFAAPVRFETDAGAAVLLGERSYRGQLLLDIEHGRINAVNIVELEDYVRGVVPNEIPPDWPLEALKAQTVASRTYALYQILHSKNPGYDLVATQLSQVYRGMGSETPRTDKAVAATAGEIITYGQRPILALFHSNNGGHSADDRYVWQSADLPYLASYPDPYSASAPDSVQHWQARFSLEELARKMSRSRLRTLAPTERTGAGRVIALSLDGRTINADRFRNAAGAGRLKSTLFELRVERGMAYFRGRGFGHGVGMSQWGARQMAVQRLSYRQILDFYYINTRLEHLRG